MLLALPCWLEQVISLHPRGRPSTTGLPLVVLPFSSHITRSWGRPRPCFLLPGLSHAESTTAAVRHCSVSVATHLPTCSILGGGAGGISSQLQLCSLGLLSRLACQVGREGFFHCLAPGAGALWYFCASFNTIFVPSCAACSSDHLLALPLPNADASRRVWVDLRLPVRSAGRSAGGPVVAGSASHQYSRGGRHLPLRLAQIYRYDYA